MVFIDNITPSEPGTYISSVQNYPQSASDRSRQLSSDWATMYYQNAYNTALMNYMNQYNSPLQQMLRYQEAGINPFTAASDAGNMGSSIPGSAPKGTFKPSNFADVLNSANNTVNTIQKVISTAADIYDYINYGAPMHGNQLALSGINIDTARANQRRAEAEANWSTYWNGAPGDQAESPRGQYMFMSTERIAKQIDQLSALVDVIYPSQAARNSAAAALDVYKQQLMAGENDPILELDTGNDMADSLLKSVLLSLKNNFRMSKVF